MNEETMYRSMSYIILSMLAMFACYAVLQAIFRPCAFITEFVLLTGYFPPVFETIQNIAQCSLG